MLMLPSAGGSLKPRLCPEMADERQFFFLHNGCPEGLINEKKEGIGIRLVRILAI